MPNDVVLSGRVFREQGMFLVRLRELDQMTHAHTLEEALADTFRLIVDHLEARRLLGTYEATLSRLGVSDAGGPVSFRVTLDLSAALVGP